MVKIDIYSGFLGAGKTTLIKKLISDGYNSEKLMIIENEFGDIGIDKGFLSETGINITEMNSGCICCSLVGDFSTALENAINEYSPDRIIIEPSGVGKLSDVIKAVRSIKQDNIEISGVTAVADASKVKLYLKNFGEFYVNQIENAKTIVLSHTGKLSDDKISLAVKLIREINNTANIITTDWDELSGKAILDVICSGKSYSEFLNELTENADNCPVCHEHHCCGHEHHDHHEHHHDCEHEHNHCEHDTSHEHNCCNHEHEHDNHCNHEGHHHADEVFTSWGTETTAKFTKEQIENFLSEFSNENKYGTILRAKGIVPSVNGWLHFDFVPGSIDIRNGAADTIGRICVIGADLKEDEISRLIKG